MPQPLIELGGEPAHPPLHIALANGFVPQTYLPMLRPFMTHYRVLCLPPRALWGAEAPPPTATHNDWAGLATDLLAGLRQYEVAPLVAIGHSFGGIASLLAALREPQRFRALVLLDPTILGQEFCAMLEQARQSGTEEEYPLVQKARRRRRHFASVEEAYERFRSRRLFAQWSDEAVWLYATYGTQPLEDGSRQLTWPPEWEAYYFNTVYTRIWEDVPKLRDLPVPLLIIAGAESDTFVPESVDRVRALVPNATYHSIAGHGHLFPQSAPQESAGLILDWLRSVGLPAPA